MTQASIKDTHDSRDGVEQKLEYFGHLYPRVSNALISNRTTTTHASIATPRPWHTAHAASTENVTVLHTQFVPVAGVVAPVYTNPAWSAAMFEPSAGKWR